MAANTSGNNRRSQAQQANQAAEVENTHEVERSHQTADQAGMEAHHTEREDVSTMEWRLPSSLDAPPPRPGFVQRWKRHQLGNEHDARNWSRAMREGWRPVNAEHVDESFAYMSDIVDGKSVITAQGLILCEMPESMAEQRTRVYENAASRQIAGVDEDLDRAQGSVPISRDRKSNSEIGRRPRVAE